MSVWAIGDLQGCYDAAQRLLERIALRSRARPAVVLRRPGQPRRPVAGDAAPGAFAARQQRRRARQPRPVAAGDRRAPRGRAAQGQSGPAARAVRRRPRRAARLAAHAEAAARRPQARLDDGARRPRAEVDHRRSPSAHAREVEEQPARRRATASCCKNMYGDKPGVVAEARPASTASARSSTSSRACATARRAAASRSRRRARPGTQPPGLYPWFEVPGTRRARTARSSAGTGRRWACSSAMGVHAIDTGAVWGGKLTALQLEPTNCASCRCRVATCRCATNASPQLPAARRGIGRVPSRSNRDARSRDLSARARSRRTRTRTRCLRIRRDARSRAATRATASAIEAREERIGAFDRRCRHGSGACARRQRQRQRVDLAAADHAQLMASSAPRSAQRLVERSHRFHALERHAARSASAPGCAAPAARARATRAVLRPISTGLPSVSALKRLRSSGRCHGRSLSRPMARSPVERGDRAPAPSRQTATGALIAGMRVVALDRDVVVAEAEDVAHVRIRVAASAAAAARARAARAPARNGSSTGARRRACARSRRRPARTTCATMCVSSA